MIKDLQKHVVELTQRLAAQNMEMYCDIDGHDSESNFENPDHNPVLVWDLSGRDEEFLLALWRQSNYVANILMITNYILLL
jgi:hypothetical protein